MNFVLPRSWFPLPEAAQLAPPGLGLCCDETPMMLLNGFLQGKWQQVLAEEGGKNTQWAQQSWRWCTALN